MHSWNAVSDPCAAIASWWAFGHHHQWRPLMWTLKYKNSSRTSSMVMVRDSPQGDRGTRAADRISRMICMLWGIKRIVCAVTSVSYVFFHGLMQHFCMQLPEAIQHAEKSYTFCWPHNLSEKVPTVKNDTPLAWKSSFCEPCKTSSKKRPNDRGGSLNCPYLEPS